MWFPALSVVAIAFGGGPAQARERESAPAPRVAALELTPEVAVRLREVAFQAAREGDLTTLAAYLDTGRPVNEPNARGDTLLTVAAYSGQESAVALILTRPKVQVDARNKMGLTALAAAAYKGHVGIARKLVAAGADVNAANGSGQTALMFAALTGRTKMVDYLLSAGAEPRMADASGNTAKTLAAKQGAAEVVRLIEAVTKRQRKDEQ
ncbi:ankyrin repeat domain-containing protein [Fimbriiglobus ruber]|uniref:Putative ankyrin-like protein n=1 Tax=Fimbriiglobus ruber TaxID=1908690 RepID=A0A225DUC4_9BACT|nr:ankyrin repeat domain-containing protein [Fimbriiglobus ruber]OWK40759.1 putative ankyrin-like protein [Fimbriiglobus ruber]